MFTEMLSSSSMNYILFSLYISDSYEKSSSFGSLSIFDLYPPGGRISDWMDELSDLPDKFLRLVGVYRPLEELSKMS